MKYVQRRRSSKYFLAYRSKCYLLAFSAVVFPSMSRIFNRPATELIVYAVIQIHLISTKLCYSLRLILLHALIELHIAQFYFSSYHFLSKFYALFQ